MLKEARVIGMDTQGQRTSAPRQANPAMNLESRLRRACEENYDPRLRPLEEQHRQQEIGVAIRGSA